ASRSRVSLSDVLRVSARALQPAVKSHGATLDIDLPKDDVYGNTDRAGLEQIVTNLVVNAAQAASHGGTVQLIARVVDQELHINVEEGGRGFPAGIIGRIFEPFFTTKPVGEGTGLGLSVTLGIVQQLGGRIAAENRSEGKGARFIVALPMNSAASQTPRAV